MHFSQYLMVYTYVAKHQIHDIITPTNPLGPLSPGSPPSPFTPKPHVTTMILARLEPNVPA